MIQIYTGEGKGKTTASVGLAVRASSTFKVLFVQVIKKGNSSEIDVLKQIPNITVKAFGEGKRIFEEEGNAKEKENLRKALDFLRENYYAYETIIVDELVTAVDLKIIEEEEVLDLLTEISAGREIVITGRGVTKKLIDKADLVTEMKKIKHYYDKGLLARKGIEL